MNFREPFPSGSRRLFSFRYFRNESIRMVAAGRNLGLGLAGVPRLGDLPNLVGIERDLRDCRLGWGSDGFSWFSPRFCREGGWIGIQQIEFERRGMAYLANLLGLPGLPRLRNTSG